MIGKVCQSVVDFYDSKTRTTRKKARPVLVVGGPRNNDYTVLPISTVKNRGNLDDEYDLPIELADRAKLNLPEECFVRTHKQMTVHEASLVRTRGDMRTDAPDLYLKALELMERYQSELMDQAL